MCAVMCIHIHHKVLDVQNKLFLWLTHDKQYFWTKKDILSLISFYFNTLNLCVLEQAF